MSRTIYVSPTRAILSDPTDPKAGGMAHLYPVTGMYIDGSACDGPAGDIGQVKFQHGPVKEVGVNGLQHADLYRILIDRLECAQAGPFACEENAAQLVLLQRALASDEARTSRRVQAGTEGLHKGV